MTKAQGQTQFVARKHPANPCRTELVTQKGEELVTAVRRSVARLDEPSDLTGPERRGGLLKSRCKRAGLACKAKAVKRTPMQQLLHPIG